MDRQGSSRKTNNPLGSWKHNTVKLGDKERLDKEQIGILRNQFKRPICHLINKDKELLALRNNFRASKKFLIAKVDCTVIIIRLNYKSQIIPLLYKYIAGKKGKMQKFTHQFNAKILSLFLLLLFFVILLKCLNNFAYFRYFSLKEKKDGSPEP